VNGIHDGWSIEVISTWMWRAVILEMEVGFISLGFQERAGAIADAI